MAEITLPENRQIHWQEYGDPSGSTIVYFHGFPGSGHDVSLADDYASGNGLRIISPDMPGIYHSTEDSSYTISSFLDNLSLILDRLKIQTFSTLGHSGGAAFALACGATFPERVNKIATVGGIAPFDTEVMRQSLNPALLPLYDLTVSDRTLAMQQYQQIAPSPEVALQSLQAFLSEADIQLLSQSAIQSISVESMTRTLRQGEAGVIDGIRAARLLWPFQLSNIHMPVDIWQGQSDKIVPATIADYLVGSLPNAEGHYIDHAGHFMIYSHWRKILEGLS